MWTNKGVLIESCLMLLLATGPFLGARLPNSQAMAAQVYYVDKNHPNASDSNLGTEALPWRTIQHAADVAQPGDTIYVKSGTYDERVVVQTSGTADAKLIFRALTRRSVLMQGFYFKGADYVRVEGFRITNALSGWTEVFGMLIDGNHIEIADNEFFDLKSVAIQGAWGLCVVDIPYVVVENNTFYDI